MLINIGNSVAKYVKDPNKIKYYAQELKQNTYNLTRMNLIMRGILPDNIVTRNGDTLEDDYNIGCYRTEPNEIINQNGKVIFSPIANIEKMNLMMNSLLEFLKDDEFSRPLEKIYKAIAFHFLFAYDLDSID